MREWGYSSINPDLCIMEMSVQPHAQAALHPGEDPPVLIGWMVPRAGLDVME
jgi:hypothetical protein